MFVLRYPTVQLANHPMPHTSTQPISSEPPPHVKAVALNQAYRLINHGPTVLVSAAHQGRRNLMAAAWNMPLDFNPPKVAVVIDKATATRGLLEASGWLALNIPCAALANVTLTVGSVTALEDTPLTQPDKFSALGLATWVPSSSDEASVPCASNTPPLVSDCIAWLLCKQLPAPELAQAHDLFLAEVTAAWADDRVFAQGKYRPLEQWPAHLRTLHHMGAGHFVLPGEAVQGQMLPPIFIQNS